VLKSGIIEAGAFAQSGAEGATENGNAEVVAVADPEPGRPAVFTGKNRIGKTFPKAEDLIRDNGIEAVHQAVPDASQAPHAIAALEAGRKEVRI